MSSRKSWFQNLSSSWVKVKFDKVFLILVLALTIMGFLIFLSATLGLQARQYESIVKIIVNQAIFGILGGIVLGIIAYHIPLRKIRDWALPIFISSVFLTFAVFIPGIGFTSGGATRWLNIGPFTLQPAEVLKIAAVIIAASWFSFLKHKASSIKLGLGAVVGIIVISSLPLLLQPDTGTPIVIATAVGVIYLIAGARKRHIVTLILIGLIGLGGLIISSDYRKERIMTFLNPATDQLDTGYQTKQSLIAIGSGGWFGRGPGQSIQKFNYLPEPVGDSIFAVYAEEYGFVGSLLLIIIYSLISYRGMLIAARLKPGFERLMVIGLIAIIMTQSILNIGAMVGVFPLSGMPLIFVSHGGSALMFSLASIGLILQASTQIPKRKRYSKKI